MQAKKILADAGGDRVGRSRNQACSCLALVLVLGFSSVALAVDPFDPSVKSGTVMVNGVSLDFQKQGGLLSNTAEVAWWYGCSPTSAGMMMGYYDRNGYSKCVLGGVAEASSYSGSAPLSTAAVANARHISDYYRNGYLANGDDLVGSPTGPQNCLADFMGTSQDAYGNVNGSTTFWGFTNGSIMTAADIYSFGPSYYNSDGMYGIKEYLNYVGYNPDPAKIFSQYIMGYNGNNQGFSLAQYRAEIDAGRPVIIQVEGHSMLGVGYASATGSDIYVFDTWTAGTHTMTWGGSYSGMTHYGVVAVESIPEPASMTLLAAGALLLLRRRRASARPARCLKR